MKKPPKVSLCEASGHDWEDTTASNVRRCRRSACRLVQRLHRHQWVNVATKARKQPVEHAQTGLWG